MRPPVRTGQFAPRAAQPLTTARTIRTGPYYWSNGILAHYTTSDFKIYTVPAPFSAKEGIAEGIPGCTATTEGHNSICVGLLGFELNRGEYILVGKWTRTLDDSWFEEEFVETSAGAVDEALSWTERVREGLRSSFSATGEELPAVEW